MGKWRGMRDSNSKPHVPNWSLKARLGEPQFIKSRQQWRVRTASPWQDHSASPSESGQE